MKYRKIDHQDGTFTHELNFVERSEDFIEGEFIDDPQVIPIEKPDPEIETALERMVAKLLHAFVIPANRIIIKTLRSIHKICWGRLREANDE